jgi:DNA mismatch endonuclease, patch repair protein
VDQVTSSQRSAQMALIGSKNSKFERAVRARLHIAGYRYRLHVRGMPGTPDLVFPARRKVVFLHSCFWHGHGCRLSRMPKSRKGYWNKKITSNRARDARNERALRRLGWKVLSVWECRFRESPDKALDRLARFLH